MIQSAKNQTLKSINGNLPNMSSTIIGWFQNITFQYVERYMVGADWKEKDPVDINTQGVVRPPSDEDLKILPEGTWSWRWLQIHCLPTVSLQTNQYVWYDGIKYTVMSKKDYSKYGYVKYTLLESYKASQL